MAEEKSIFQILREKAEQVKNIVKENTIRRINHARERQEKTIQEIIKIRKEAEEFSSLIQDKRYPHYQNFLDELIQDIDYQLLWLSQESVTIDRQALESKGLLKQKELLLKLKYHPQEIVEWLEKNIKRNQGE